MAKNRDSSTTPDQAARDRILRDLDSSLLVEASAGTGKTTSMVGRMVELLRRGKCGIETLAAVTFTRKAAAELRERFQTGLERAAREARGEARERLGHGVVHVERCFIGTIHSFCGRLLRERPIEAGVDPRFEVLEPEVDATVREEAWREHLAELFARDDPILAELDDLGLETGQLRGAFVKYAEYPDVGEWPAVKPAMDDPRAAMEELAAYASHMDVLSSKLPEDPGSDRLMASYRSVPRRLRQARLDRPRELMEVLEEFRELERGKVTQKLWAQVGLDPLKELERWNDFARRHAAPHVQRWRERRYEAVLRLFKSTIAAYQRRRRAAGGLNNQDLLLEAAKLLRSGRAVREYFRGRFTHLLVDEFQDTDPIQAEVMLLLTASDPAENDWRRCRPIPGALFVVGDPKQSIYRFRRADIVTYNKVKEMIVSSGGKVVALTASFRTVEPLIGWINARFDPEFPEEADPYKPSRSSLEAGRLDDGEGILHGIRRIDIPDGLKTKAEIHDYEAKRIARTIRRAIDERLTIPRTARELRAGVSPEARPCDFLVIARGKKNLTAYARELQALGIPHQVTGGSVLSVVKELGLLHACIRAVTEPHDPTALVALLRGEAFGMSDAALYAFRKAGGRFSFPSQVPEELAARDPGGVKQLEDAFERLTRYDGWLDRLPPVPAFERIAADLGLFARAAAGEGGNAQAGSLSKALETLRAVSWELPSASDVVDHLSRLITDDTDDAGVESLPARPYEEPPARIMNLHKAKGLEAPVVFLADPTGKKAHEPNLHIDRSGDAVKGYLVVREERSDSRSFAHPALLALPPGWEERAAEEQEFIDAEETRLHYVAATRAGAQLVITQRGKFENLNPWTVFKAALEGSKALEDPGEQKAPRGEAVAIHDRDIEAALEVLAARAGAARRPTYATAAAKAISVEAIPAGASGGDAGEAGASWGTVIHELLETAMKSPGADILGLAHAALEEEELDPGRAEEAVETVQSVMRSEIWRRALAAKRRMTEVPFERLLASGEAAPGAPPTLLRGVIDLVFEEPSGWVIADYKTDAAAKKDLAALVEHYRPQLDLYQRSWESMTGEMVRETGLFFTRVEKYVPLETGR